MKRNITRKMICLLVLFVAAVFVGADLPAAAQNTNSGSTGDTMMQNTNTGNASARRGRRRARRQVRRARRRARRNADMTGANANMSDANANMSDMSGNANMSGDTTGTQDTNMNMSGDTTGTTNAGRRGRRGRRGARRAARRTADANANTTDADTTATPDTTGTQDMNTNTSGGGQGGSMPGMGTFGDVADLSGTYTGTINYAEGGMSGEATLTITSNTFTITAGSATASGTLSARSWPGYTALSMRFGDTLPATIISTRAWHRGRTLRIQSVRGESRAFTFNGRSGS